MPEYLTITPELTTLLANEPERRQLQVGVLNRLMAYFDASYQVFQEDHPASDVPVIIWMTQDLDRPDNPFQGPIPLLFRPSGMFAKFAGRIDDYRWANDSRAGVYGASQGDLNPEIVSVLNLPNDSLTEMAEKIDDRMQALNDPYKRQSFAEDIKRWEQENNYTRNDPELEPIFGDEELDHDQDNLEALTELAELYFQNLTKAQENSSTHPDQEN